MTKKKLFPNLTNKKRADAGSENGLAGRQYPIDVAKKLNTDLNYVSILCRKLKKKDEDFLRAEAGKDIPARVENVVANGKKVEPKVKLRVLWKDGTVTNFRVTISSSSQIHLEKTENFIEEFEKQYGKKIPKKVKDALLLFTGRHPLQDKILSGIPIAYVGEKIRQNVEKNYFNRLTLASMYGYDEDMPTALLNWFKCNCADIFQFCFSLGAAKEKKWHADYIWYRSDASDLNTYELYDLKAIEKNIRSSPKTQNIKANDNEQIGSTIAFPFGNLQQHENKLQFRHNREKIQTLACYCKSGLKNNFGSKPKISGHLNEELIAYSLNKNKDFRIHFCERLGLDEKDFVAATAGGKNAKMEESVLGGKTAGKTDVAVLWKGGYLTNISIKKRASGQVYLVTAKNFVSAYEAQYKSSIPEKVQQALALFIGEALNSRTILDATDISIDGKEARVQAYEQNFRLMFEVIRNHDEKMAKELLLWLKKEIVSIFEICFSAGAVKNRECWAHILWYKNLVDEEGQGLDFMIPIKKVMIALERNADKNIVERGPKLAGSTIQLPFGHLQYHLKQLEFYQKLSKIQKLLLSA